MIKKCKIVSINDVVMVVDYAGTLVQFPSNHTADSYVFVKRDTGNKFSIVSAESMKMRSKTRTESVSEN